MVQNSTNNQEWSSFQIKWKSPTKYPAGKITIRFISKFSDIFFDSPADSRRSDLGRHEAAARTNKNTASGKKNLRRASD